MFRWRTPAGQGPVGHSGFNLHGQGLWAGRDRLLWLLPEENSAQRTDRNVLASIGVGKMRETEAPHTANGLEAIVNSMERIIDSEAVMHLEPWQTAAQDGVQTPFQSNAWLCHWRQHRGQYLEPFTLNIAGGSTIAPLGRYRTKGVRVLQLLGTGDSDFAGLITTRTPEEAWDAVVRELVRRRSQWDLLHLHSVAHPDAIASALQRQLGHRGYSRVYEQCPSITVKGTWQDFLSHHKELRREIKRWTRRMEESGAVSVEMVRPPLGDALLGEMVAVERASWRWNHGNAALKPGTQRDFLFALLKDGTTPAHVWLLRIADELAAFALTLEAANQWFYYLTVFRDEQKNAGSFLLSRIVERAHEEGISAMSLLRGDHKYKAVWADTRESVYEIVCPTNVRGHALAALHRLRWRAARSPRMQRLRSAILRVGDRRP